MWRMIGGKDINRKEDELPRLRGPDNYCWYRAGRVLEVISLLLKQVPRGRMRKMQTWDQSERSQLEQQFHTIIH